MIFDIILIIVGIVAVLYGADRMTEGAVALAKRIHIPEIVIGLTIVAIGTSAPELFVSTVSALNGTPDLAVGNVVGSNTFNTLLIAGAAAAVAPIDISRITVKRDLPLAALSSLLLIVLCLDSDISRTDALMLFAGFIIFMVITVMPAIKDHKDSEQPTAEAAKTDSETAKAPYSVTKAVGTACCRKQHFRRQRIATGCCTRCQPGRSRSDNSCRRNVSARTGYERRGCPQGSKRNSNRQRLGVKHLQ